MIIEREGRINKPRRGVMALAKNNISLRDLVTDWSILYNPTIPSGLKLHKVTDLHL